MDASTEPDEATPAVAAKPGLLNQKANPAIIVIALLLLAGLFWGLYRANLPHQRPPARPPGFGGAAQ